MKIHYASDLHDESHLIDIEKFNVVNSSEDILILAGDILNIVTLLQDTYNYVKFNEESNLIKFFDYISFKFKHIIYITGNHEVYLGGDINESPKQLKLALS